MSKLSVARALLLGTGMHDAASGLPDLPAVAHTLADLKAVLVERCGLARDAVRVELDPATPMELGETVAAEAEQAAGLLVVYFIGHGLVSTEGALHLATRATDPRPTRLQHTAMAYSTVRRYLLERSGPCVVVLDCCFSGRAFGFLGDPDEEIASLADIAGGFVLTSAGREELAMAPVGERHTAFSGALLRLLVMGDADGPAELTLRDVCRCLARDLPAAGFPRPRYRSTGPLDELVLAPNPAYRPMLYAVAPSAAPRPQQAFGPRDEGVLVDACPYKGLAAFEVGDAQWFFGRERLTAVVARRLAERYDDARPLLVTGASGSGKSSLLRAGLLPAISRGDLGLAGSVSWPRLLLTPTAGPVGALAAKVGELAGLPADQVADEIRTDPYRLVGILRRALQLQANGRDLASARAVLVVDQFEETFTLCDDERERRGFIRALCAAADGDGGATVALVLLGVRADFYGQCAGYPELVAAMERRQVVVGPMTSSELQAAIEKPAAAAGIAVEPGLVEVLLADLGVRVSPHNVAGGGEGEGSVNGDLTIAYEAGRLPLLAHALLATWQQRMGPTLTVAGYRETGGIHGALAVTADTVMAQFDHIERRMARELLLRLVHIGDGTEDTRRRVDRMSLLAELSDPSRAAKILDAFATDAARLVTVDQGEVVITHDALLREWPTLRAWIDTDRAGLLVEQQLVDAARAWDRDGRDDASLYRGSRLLVPREWASDQRHRDSLGSLARAFLDKSIEHDRKQQQATRRRTRVWMGLTAALGVLLVLVAVAWRSASDQRRIAEGQRRNAEAQRLVATSRDLIFQAEFLRDSHPATSLRLSIAAMTINPTPQTRTSLISTLLGTRKADTLAVANFGDIGGLVFSPSRRILLIASNGQRPAVLWDVSDIAHPHRLGILPELTNFAGAATFSPDGLILAAAANEVNAPVVLWDLKDAVHPRRLVSLPGRDSAGPAAFSPNGQILATVTFKGSVVLWDVADRVHPHQLATVPSNGDVRFALFSPNGRVLATTAAHNIHAVVLWDVADRVHPHELGTLPGASGMFTSDAAFSRDGRLLAIAVPDASAVVLWDVADRVHPRRLATLPGGGSNRLVALSRDGRTLATGDSPPAPVVVWDVADRVHPHRLASLPNLGLPELVAFSPDGRILYAATIGTAKVLWSVIDWANSVSHPLDQACMIAERGLNPTEWANYLPGMPYQHTCAS